MIFSFQAKEGSSTLGSPFNKLSLSDIPGDPGSQLPYQEFSSRSRVANGNSETTGLGLLQGN
jgi:hypothetical protein|tara:strand:- start:36 stop:221 length:186 start_codon:yes stop_codon:yes gene_type:complete